MYRFALEKLMEWKNMPRRKPLIIRGARQVGKTWLMQEFGRTYFEQTAYINFDVNTPIRKVFEGSLEPERLLLAISAEAGLPVTAENTLIIFDEVQECPRALTSLKYFQETHPEYAIVAAGSLLGVALHQGTSFPVGKVDFMDLYPLSYREFLIALGEEVLLKLLDSLDYEMITAFREKFIDLLKQYFFIGGMPEAVANFIQTKDFQKVRQIQKNLIAYYQQDFSKHAPSGQIARLNQVWQSIPLQLARENRKFMYGLVREGARAKDFELAIQWLSDCGLVHKVTRAKKPGMPLIAYMEMSAFKLYLADIGLLGAMSDLPVQALVDGSRIFVEFKGALTEQYVLQQLVSETEFTPYYFSADNSRMEVDFLFQNGIQIVPLEVKAEENLRAKSLRLYCEKYNPELAVRTSMSDYRRQDWMTNVPLYLLPSFLRGLPIS